MYSNRISRIISEAIEQALGRFTTEAEDAYAVFRDFVNNFNNNHQKTVHPTYDISPLSKSSTISSFSVSLTVNNLVYRWRFDFMVSHLVIMKYVIIDRFVKRVGLGEEYYTSERYDAETVCSKILAEMEDIRENQKDLSGTAPVDKSRVELDMAKLKKVRNMIYLMIKTAMQGFPQIKTIDEYMNTLLCEVEVPDGENGRRLATISFHYDKHGRLLVSLYGKSYSFDWDNLKTDNMYQFIVELLQELIDRV